MKAAMGSAMHSNKKCSGLPREKGSVILDADVLRKALTMQYVIRPTLIQESENTDYTTKKMDSTES